MSAKNAVVTKYFSGQGILLIGEKDAVTGKAKGFTNVGNVSDLKLGIKTSTIEHKESSTGARGIDKLLTTEIAVDVTATLESLNKENLAVAMRAELTSKGAGAVVDESVIAYSGKTVALANINVTLVVVKDETGVTTYDLNDDYTVNAEVGSINIVAGGAIADEDVLHVSYSYAAQDVLEAMTEAQKDYVLRFEGLNTADGNDPVVVEVFKFASNPLKELALINDKLADISLEGKAQADPTQTGSQYYKVTMSKSL